MKDRSYLNFQLHHPAEALRPFIKHYWTISRPVAAVSRTTEYLPGDGGSCLILNFSDAVCLNQQPFTDAALYRGPTTQTTAFMPGKRIDMIGIHFYPGMAYPFVQQPMCELFQEILPATDIWQASHWHSLHEQLAERPLIEQRLHCLNRWLLERLCAADQVHTAIKKSVNWLRQCAPAHTLDQLTAQVCLSQRQLERLFNHQVGMTPKRYCQVARVGRARQVIKASSQKTSLSEQALIAGYYDQAHLTREFKKMVGLTPAAYRRQIDADRRAEKISLPADTELASYDSPCI
ncbi:helix-turn-helix domain-containing protein [Marinobacterium jannaschii]|uniref:helix-turn-helix domain-containing protein n=1 Tax=Marinobacterium jannaschii TaxID=64970 RepID=UPI0004823BF5|nr:helix-turn-helix domain-containing protein [Marinobacterium jannaschii]